MSLANQKQKDSAMAAMLKRLGIERRSCSCPICHHLVGLASLEGHILSCKGRR
jgi:hypothetical protein